jgi:hypothetical protein
MPHHRASVNSNRDITTAQIQANEKERFGNDISYMAAYRTREKLREEIEGKEDLGVLSHDVRIRFRRGIMTRSLQR